jgi:hypothetical protein
MENIKSYVQENKDRFIKELIELLNTICKCWILLTLKMLSIQGRKAKFRAKQDVIL